MKAIHSILVLIILLVVVSCFDPPQFSDTPSITIDDVRVKEVPGAATPDSLIITINFQDGDGNIGLEGSENEPPFNERWFFLINPTATCEDGVLAPCTKKSFIDESNLDNYVSYSLRRTSVDYDTLPQFIPPYDCSRYFVLKNANNVALDTLYNQLNPRYNNIFVDVLVKNGATFEKFDFLGQGYPRCDIYGLNGRLPILAKGQDLSQELPLEGTITYKITSASFSPLIGKTLKLQIWIMDRDGNTSNVDVSNEFTLN